MKLKLKRVLLTVLFVLFGFVLQGTLFQRLALGSVKPNLLLVIVVIMLV